MIIEHMILLLLECFKNLLVFQKVVSGDWFDKGNEEESHDRDQPWFAGFLPLQLDGITYSEGED